MTPDTHTPCPFCAEPARALYVAAVLLDGLVAELLARGVPATLELRRPLVDAWKETRLALGAAQPFVEAHGANQDHALSVELADARHPRLAADAPPPQQALRL